MQLENGVFIVSLDFELYWGVRDKRSLPQYKENLQGVKEVVPELLRLFRRHDIHATWAAVGFLFFESRADLVENLPTTYPDYQNKRLSPYEYIHLNAYLEPTYHYAPDLIDQITQNAGQEIATHTFSHYYCLEQGQTLADFEADLCSAIKIAQRKGIPTTSLVFPRNQWNPEYLSVLRRLGIECYRGNESSWIYQASSDTAQSLTRRGLRLLDAYINMSGPNVYDLNSCANERPFNFPSSRFLRPYKAPLAILDPLRLKRITGSMSHAAKTAQIFHLWWHPHNFGFDIDRNLRFLEKILRHYGRLKKTYGMTSLNMKEMSELCNAAA